MLFRSEYLNGNFAPVVAGAGKMPYRRFVAFSLCGAVCWITSMILLGYTLHLWLEPILEGIFGRKIEVARNIDKLVIVIVLLSVIPIVWKWWTHRRPPSPPPGVPPVPASTTPPVGPV